MFNLIDEDGTGWIDDQELENFHAIMLSLVQKADKADFVAKSFSKQMAQHRKIVADIKCTLDRK
eukprot:scaffold677260_cov88-Prasinocladus_malaysianus.AAC.1